jgi:GTP diphosphokinase / guanosine-3',5'-bis(diphosphate) 3'-diphosphatase
MQTLTRHEERTAAYDQRYEKRLINEIMELLVTHYGGELSEEALDERIANLHRALEIGRSSHSAQVRKSGEPYFFHPLRVAHLAARHWMDFSSIIAALLHDVVEDTPFTISQVRGEFGSEVELLVNGLTKVDDAKLDKKDLKAETYRKQLLAAIEDVRVLCLKFWDRIDNLQTIGALTPEKQIRIAEETRSVYVPLAMHLGMGYVAAELEALSLKVIHPARAERYAVATRALMADVDPNLRKIKGNIQRSVDQHKIPVLLRDRWRPFSIAGARALKRGVTTLYTLEIQVDRMMDAYMVLGLLHSLYHPIPGKLRDHLNSPSQFGYQALKTSVQAGEYRLRVEITTRKLARFNEAGVLAPGFDFQLSNFKELMQSLMEGESAVDTDSLRLASASIRVYTPRGDLRILPEGSSALDLAFDIHENLGLHAFRAKINGHTRLLKSRLMDGDQVAIERDVVAQVLPKWLEWAVTPKARNAIRRYLRSKVKQSR